MSNLSCNNYILRLSAVHLAGLLMLSVPATSFAYFSGDAMAIENTFTAGTMSFDAPTNISVDVDASNPATTSFSLIDTGNIDADYLIATAPVTCDADFYNGLEAELQNPAAIFDGMLSGLSATSTDAGVIDLILQASSTMVATQNETCTVELTILTWQSGFPSVNFGFSEVKTILLTITASEDIGVTPPLAPLPTANVVLNEIYPTVLATSTIPLEREWVELYNGTTGPIDVAGWIISEFVGGSTLNDEDLHTIVSDCTGYPSSTYASPFGTTNTVISPGGYLVVTFCGTAGYLNNSGDTVRLYDASGTSTPWIDTHTFGTTAAGKSHARIPDGGTWVDPFPSPGAVNVATKEDLEAEGWSKEQIIEVLGEDVYRDVEVIDGEQPAVFNFATSSDDILFGFATSSATSSTEVASSTNPTASSTSASSTTPTLPVEVSTSSASTSTKEIETTATSTQLTPDPKVTDEEKTETEDRAPIPKEEDVKLEESADKKPKEPVVTNEENDEVKEDTDPVPKIETEKSDEDTPPEPPPESSTPVTNEEI